MSTVQPPEARGAFRAFAAISALIGIGTLALSGTAWAEKWGQAATPLLQITAIAVTAIVLLVVARSPLVMSGARGEVTILLDTTTYVVVAHVAPFSVAVQCIAVGMIVACWTLSMNTLVRMVHVTAATTVWTAIVAAKPFVDGLLSGFPQLLATTLTLGVLGEVGTLAVVAVTAHFSRGRNAFKLFRASFGVELAVGLAQGALACLTVEIIRDAPAAAALLTVPIGMLMVISRALIRSQLSNIRSSVLSDAVIHLQQCADPEAVLRSTVEHAARMLRSRHTQYTDYPRGEGEIAAAVHRPDGTELQLVAAPRTTNERFRPEDEQALVALTSTTTAALRTIDLIATMRWRAMHDALTQLPNRSLFLEQAEQALTERRPDELVAVLFVDLDGFKMVNDTLGHDAGDAMLRETATRLGQLIKAPNTVARLGGDEFCILLRDVRLREAVEDIVEELCQRVAEPILLEGRQASVGASIGIAIAPQDGIVTETLMQRADERMYACKQARRSVSRPANGAGSRGADNPKLLDSPRR